MANREICDVKHPSIKDADELWIFCHKENRFKVFSRADYPKPKGSICQLCPNGMKRTNDLVIFCQTKVETWSTLKSHLVTIERIYGELVAFPLDMREEDLPPVSNYGHKYRAYGQLADYQEKEEIYVFDVARGKFITAKRNMLSKMYTKYGCCNYCPCPRKVQSPSSILQHIQSIENRFFCYLILDNEGQNDRRNQEKIQIFVNSIKSGEQYARLQEQFQEIKQNRLSPDCGRYYNQSEDERSQSSEYLSLNEENERMPGGEQMNEAYGDQENAVLVLEQMERTLRRDYQKLSSFFGKLRSKVNICSLDQSIINSQEQLILSKRDENHETKEKNLSFTRKIELDEEDLAYLLKKYNVPQDYRIKNVDVNLNLNLRLRADQSPGVDYEVENGNEFDENGNEFDENGDEFNENGDEFDDEMQDETSRQSVTAIDEDGHQLDHSSYNGLSLQFPHNSFAIKREHDDDDN